MNFANFVEKEKLKYMKYLKLLIATLSIFFSANAFCQTSQQISVPKDVEKWITSTFAKGKLPPFSFVYGDQNSKEFIRRWRHSIQKVESQSEDVVKYIVTYSEPKGGLKVDCHIEGFKDDNAAEWLLYFSNTAKENSQQIKQVKVIDYTLKSQSEEPFEVLNPDGNSHSRTDFHPRIYPITAEKPLHKEPANGRSSDTSAFPFFNLISPDGNGIVAAIGWTGTWEADFTVSAAKQVRFSSGMKNMDLHLLPNESIRTPRIAILFWQGEDYMIGQNSFRRFIKDHHTHKVDDKFGHTPLCGGFDWGDPAPCNEYGCLTEELAVALVKRYKMFGILPEVFWLDAGWYEGSGGVNGTWWNTVGNWEVDKERFPQGLKPIAEAAHRVGSKFMVWFEPERVYQGTIMEREHPQWLLRDGSANSLFDLGNAEANEWLCKYIGDFIEQNGIDYYRQDFNMAAAHYWAKYDEPKRIGMKEIRYVEGLYKYWDYLLERFPQMIIDNCASGGRRIDLETTSRSIPLWRTDYQYGEPNGYQCHTYGLNFFLPYHGTGLYGANSYNFLSSMSSATVMNWELLSQRNSIPEMQKVIAKLKQIRPYYMEDYYPLTGITENTGEDVWLAYQLHRQTDDTGIIIAFRRAANTQESIEVSLRAIDNEKNYTLTSYTDGTTKTLNGAELKKVLKIELKLPRSATLIEYAPAK